MTVPNKERAGRRRCFQIINASKVWEGNCDHKEQSAELDCRADHVHQNALANSPKIHECQRTDKCEEDAPGRDA